VNPIQVVEAVLRDIGAGETPHLIVPNKVDLAMLPPRQSIGSNGASVVCPISALTGKGIDQLLEAVGRILDQGKERIQFCLSPSQGNLLSLLQQRGRILEEKYEESRVYVTALVTPKLAGQMRKWLRENGSC
jgi:GTP-binding protein HflX